MVILSYDIAPEGDFVYSLDDLNGLGQSSYNGLKICMNAPYQLSGSGVNSIAFTVTGSGDAGKPIWNAMSKAITAEITRKYRLYFIRRIRYNFLAFEWKDFFYN